MVEVEHAPLRRVQLDPMRGVVEVLHRALDFGFDLRVLRLVIERAVLKDDVFPFRQPLVRDWAETLIE